MAQQLAFDLPANVALGADDFFVSEANAQAYALVTTPATWPDGKLALVGPAGSGKTHLSRVFMSGGATVTNATDIDPNAPLPETALVVEDCEALPARCEEWLFHTHNNLRALNLPFMVTGKTAPARWNITLPDLASRLNAATTATITAPDDALLLAVLLKHFQDRQLTPTPDAITYLNVHLPRAFDAIGDAVQTLDKAALAQSKPITRPFVRAVLTDILDT